MRLVAVSRTEKEGFRSCLKAAVDRVVFSAGGRRFHACNGKRPLTELQSGSWDDQGVVKHSTKREVDDRRENVGQVSWCLAD